MRPAPTLSIAEGDLADNLRSYVRVAAVRRGPPRSAASRVLPTKSIVRRRL
jgi:hypothetical protein